MDKSIALYLFVSFVACITPGSGVLYTIASGFRGGMKCVLASPLGTCLGCSLMSALSATGLGALIANSPAAYNVLQVVSALVLVWFGLQSWRSGALDLSAASDSAAREGLGSGQERFTFRKFFWGAVVLQASNIMLIVFLLSLMPPFIRTEEPYLPQAVMLSALFVLVCFVVHLVGLQLDRRCRRQAARRPKVLLLAQPHQRRSFLAPCGERYLERFFQELKIRVGIVRSAADPCLGALLSSSLTARLGWLSPASVYGVRSIRKVLTS